MLNITPPHYLYCPFCSIKLNTRIEEGKDRLFCPQCGWVYYPHVGASVGALIVRGKKVLMVKRKREPYVGTWMFPAGFVDYGEHPEDTLKREVTEETGLTVLDHELIAILQVDDDPRAEGHFEFFYKATVSDGDVKNDTDENEAIDWFDIHNLPEIGWHSHLHVAKLLDNQMTR